MFQILSIVFAVLISLAFPPAAFILIPCVIIWWSKTSAKKNELKRQRDVYVGWERDRDRQAAFRSLG